MKQGTRFLALVLVAIAAGFLSVGCAVYVLTIATNGNGTVSPDGKLYAADSIVTLTAIPDSGWEFVGWSGDASGSTASIDVVMDSNKSVVANFSEIATSNYTLTVYTNGSGTVSPSGGTYAEGKTVTLTATPASGWEFVSWTGDASGSSTTVSVTMTSDLSVTANFSEENNNEGVSAADAVSAMGIGWNLGNTLDAIGGETAWGNPAATQGLINAVHSAGFGVVRIPVTWIGHFGDAPDYTIDTSWMNRVEEVVNYVLNTGMYAIINLHHDGAEGMGGEWLALDVPGLTGTVTESHNASVQDQFVKIWEQIADHFKNYDDNLIFESMNELHVGYSDPQSSYYPIVNNLNQAFVDTVRASGGNNSDRILIVPGYNTSITYTLAGFAIPSDSADDKLILSCHYYDPWTFAILGSTLVWGADYSGNDGWAQEDYVLQQFDSLKNTYVDQDLPVILGEYGAVNPADSNYSDFRRYYLEYVTKAAHDRGIVPIYWDNGSTTIGSEPFGMFDRDSYDVEHQEVLEAMMRAVTSSYAIDDIAKP